MPAPVSLASTSRTGIAFDRAFVLKFGQPSNAPAGAMTGLIKASGDPSKDDLSPAALAELLDAQAKGWSQAA